MKALMALARSFKTWFSQGVRELREVFDFGTKTNMIAVVGYGQLAGSGLTRSSEKRVGNLAVQVRQINPNAIFVGLQGHVLADMTAAAMTFAFKTHGHVGIPDTGMFDVDAFVHTVEKQESHGAVVVVVPPGNQGRFASRYMSSVYCYVPQKLSAGDILIRRTNGIVNVVNVIEARASPLLQQAHTA